MRSTMRRVTLITCVTILPIFSVEAQHLKVFISVDMEGITGLVHGDQVSRNGSDYQMARRWMTQEANAAVQGALDAGATEVVVNDSHGDMRNIILADLNPAATLITGSPKPYSMMQGLDGTFDAVVCIGYHPFEGTTDGVLNHTMSGGTVYSVKINGVEMPELGLNALVAGMHKVPIVFVAGDKAVCEQAKTLLGDKVVTVAVKEGIGKRAAKSMPLTAAHEMIRKQVQAAVAGRKNMPLYTLKAPYVFEMSYFRTSQAEAPILIPGVTLVNPKTVRFSQDDYLTGFKLMRALILLGSD